jgi:hypothetical protein
MAAMEFSYRISEAEYRKVTVLQQMGSTRSTQIKMIVFWLFILVCLMLLWEIVQRSVPTSPMQPTPPVHSVPSPHTGTTPVIVCLYAIGFLLVCVWSVSQSRSRSRNNYRKDPELQGVFTANLTPQSISIKNSAGTSFEGVWSVYESWREKLDLILLKRRNGTSLALNLAGLSEPQRAELRGILAAALPQK